MGKTVIFYDPLYLEHDTGFGHPERAERLEATMELLEKTGLSDKVAVDSPRDATLEEIELVHPAGYIEKVRKMAESGSGYLDADTPVSHRSFAVALRSAGANLEGLERIFSGEIENAFCLARPPGHHATPGRGMGFCLFNNNAIASRFAMEKWGVRRVFILDWDAHHGNGLQDIFYDDNKVLYASLHQYPHYPGSGSYREIGEGEGEGYTVNFPLPASSSEEVYLAAFDRVILPIARQYEPELVLISAGFDGHFSDPLCSMMLSSNSYTEMTTRLKDLADRCCQGRIMASLEGGYNLAGISASMVNVISVLAGEDIRVREEGEPSAQTLSLQRAMDVVEATRESMSSYWSL